eukprot:3826072-Rhodomonas_salina.1
MLIGRKGQNIKKIEEMTKARVAVNQTDKTVHITASKETMEHAIKVVEEDILRIKGEREQRENSPRPTGGERGGAGAGEETKILQVEADLVGVLIGRGGATLKDLMEKSNTKIFVDMQSETDSKDIMVRGSKTAVEAAAKLIEDHLEEFRGKQSQREILLFSDRQIGAIIGRGGANIYKVKEESGAQITIVPRSNEDLDVDAEHDDREVMLRCARLLPPLAALPPPPPPPPAGTAAQIEAAKLMIKQVVEESQETIDRKANEVRPVTSP